MATGFRRQRVVLTRGSAGGVHGLILRKEAGPSTDTAQQAPPLVALFLIGFIAMVVVGSVFDLPQSLLDVLGSIKDALPAAAMFGLGTGVVVAKLVTSGGKAMALGALSSLPIAMAAFVVVTFVVQHISRDRRARSPGSPRR